MDATFVLVVVKISVDVVVVLEPVLDVATVGVAVDVLVGVATGHHEAAVYVGVVQLARLAVDKPAERVVVPPDARQCRAERRPKKSGRQHRDPVDRRRRQRHRRRPSDAEVRQRRDVRRRIGDRVDAAEIWLIAGVQKRVQLAAAVWHLAGRREATLGPRRDRVGARRPQVTRLVEVVGATAGRVDDRAAVGVDAQQVPGRREVVVADAGRRRQRRREAAPTYVEDGECHLAVDAVRLEAEPMTAPDVDVAVGADGGARKAHKPGAGNGVAGVRGRGRVADEHAADGVHVADHEEESGAVDKNRRHGTHVRHRRLQVHGRRRRAAGASATSPLSEHQQGQSTAADVERQDVNALQVTRIGKVMWQQQEEDARVQRACADRQASRHDAKRRLGTQRQSTPELTDHVVQIDTEVLHRRVAVQSDENWIGRLTRFKYGTHELARQVVVVFNVVVIVVDKCCALLHFLQRRTASCTSHPKYAD